jgi:hypothetical protein
VHSLYVYSLCTKVCCLCIACVLTIQTGQCLAWKFIKFHTLRHIVHHIILFGWWENCSCQVGECCHKFYLKLIKRLTNNKEDWQKQVFNTHTKDQALRLIIGELGNISHCCNCVACVQFFCLFCCKTCTD